MLLSQTAPRSDVLCADALRPVVKRGAAGMTTAEWRRPLLLLAVALWSGVQRGVQRVWAVSWTWNGPVSGTATWQNSAYWQPVTSDWPCRSGVYGVTSDTISISLTGSSDLVLTNMPANCTAASLVLNAVASVRSLTVTQSPTQGFTTAARARWTNDIRCDGGNCRLEYTQPIDLFRVSALAGVNFTISTQTVAGADITWTSALGGLAFANGVTLRVVSGGNINASLAVTATSGWDDDRMTLQFALAAYAAARTITLPPTPVMRSALYFEKFGPTGAPGVAVLNNVFAVHGVAVFSAGNWTLNAAPTAGYVSNFAGKLNVTGVNTTVTFISPSLEPGSAVWLATPTSVLSVRSGYVTGTVSGRGVVECGDGALLQDTFFANKPLTRNMTALRVVSGTVSGECWLQGPNTPGTTLSIVIPVQASCTGCVVMPKVSVAGVTYNFTSLTLGQALGPGGAATGTLSAYRLSPAISSSTTVNILGGTGSGLLSGLLQGYTSPDPPWPVRVTANIGAYDLTLRGVNLLQGTRFGMGKGVRTITFSGSNVISAGTTEGYNLFAAHTTMFDAGAAVNITAYNTVTFTNHWINFGPTGQASDYCSLNLMGTSAVASFTYIAMGQSAPAYFGNMIVNGAGSGTTGAVVGSTMDHCAGCFVRVINTARWELPIGTTDGLLELWQSSIGGSWTTISCSTLISPAVGITTRIDGAVNLVGLTTGWAGTLLLFGAQLQLGFALGMRAATGLNGAPISLTCDGTSTLSGVIDIGGATLIGASVAAPCWVGSSAQLTLTGTSDASAPQGGTIAEGRFAINSNSVLFLGAGITVTGHIGYGASFVGYAPCWVTFSGCTLAGDAGRTIYIPAPVQVRGPQNPDTTYINTGAMGFNFPSFTSWGGNLRINVSAPSGSVTLQNVSMTGLGALYIDGNRGPPGVPTVIIGNSTAPGYLAGTIVSRTPNAAVSLSGISMGLGVTSQGANNALTINGGTITSVAAMYYRYNVTIVQHTMQGNAIVLSGCTVTNGAVFGTIASLQGPSLGDITTFQTSTAVMNIGTLVAIAGTVVFAGPYPTYFGTARVQLGSAAVFAACDGVPGSFAGTLDLYSSVARFSGPISVAAGYNAYVSFGTIATGSTLRIDGNFTCAFPNAVTVSPSTVFDGSGTFKMRNGCTVFGPTSVNTRTVEGPMTVLDTVVFGGSGIVIGGAYAFGAGTMNLISGTQLTLVNARMHASTTVSMMQPGTVFNCSLCKLDIPGVLQTLSFNGGGAANSLVGGTYVTSTYAQITFTSVTILPNTNITTGAGLPFAVGQMSLFSGVVVVAPQDWSGFLGNVGFGNADADTVTVNGGVGTSGPGAALVKLYNLIVLGQLVGQSGASFLVTGVFQPAPLPSRPSVSIASGSTFSTTNFNPGMPPNGMLVRLIGTGHPSVLAPYPPTYYMDSVLGANQKVQVIGLGTTFEPMTVATGVNMDTGSEIYFTSGSVCQSTYGGFYFNTGATLWFAGGSYISGRQYSGGLVVPIRFIGDGPVRVLVYSASCQITNIQNFNTTLILDDGLTNSPAPGLTRLITLGITSVAPGVSGVSLESDTPALVNSMRVMLQGTTVINAGATLTCRGLSLYSAGIQILGRLVVDQGTSWDGTGLLNPALPSSGTLQFRNGGTIHGPSRQRNWDGGAALTILGPYAGDTMLIGIGELYGGNDVYLPRMQLGGRIAINSTMNWFTIEKLNVTTPTGEITSSRANLNFTRVDMTPSGSLALWGSAAGVGGPIAYGGTPGFPATDGVSNQFSIVYTFYATYTANAISMYDKVYLNPVYQSSLATGASSAGRLNMAGCTWGAGVNFPNIGVNVIPSPTPTIIDCSAPRSVSLATWSGSVALTGTNALVLSASLVQSSATLDGNNFQTPITGALSMGSFAFFVARNVAIGAGALAFLCGAPPCGGIASTSNFLLGVSTARVQMNTMNIQSGARFSGGATPATSGRLQLYTSSLTAPIAAYAINVTIDTMGTATTLGNGPSGWCYFLSPVIWSATLSLSGSAVHLFMGAAQPQSGATIDFAGGNMVNITRFSSAYESWMTGSIRNGPGLFLMDRVPVRTALTFSYGFISISGQTWSYPNEALATVDFADAAIQPYTSFGNLTLRGPNTNSNTVRITSPFAHTDGLWTNMAGKMTLLPNAIPTAPTGSPDNDVRIRDLTAMAGCTMGLNPPGYEVVYHGTIRFVPGVTSGCTPPFTQCTLNVANGGLLFGNATVIGPVTWLDPVSAGTQIIGQLTFAGPNFVIVAVNNRFVGYPVQDVDGLLYLQGDGLLSGAWTASNVHTGVLVGPDVGRVLTMDGGGTIGFPAIQWSGIINATSSSLTTFYVPGRAVMTHPQAGLHLWTCSSGGGGLQMKTNSPLLQGRIFNGGCTPGNYWNADITGSGLAEGTTLVIQGGLQLTPSPTLSINGTLRFVGGKVNLGLRDTPTDLLGVGRVEAFGTNFQTGIMQLTRANLMSSVITTGGATGAFSATIPAGQNVTLGGAGSIASTPTINGVLTLTGGINLHQAFRPAGSGTMVFADGTPVVQCCNFVWDVANVVGPPPGTTLQTGSLGAGPTNVINGVWTVDGSIAFRSAGYTIASFIMRSGSTGTIMSYGNIVCGSGSSLNGTLYVSHNQGGITLQSGAILRANAVMSQTVAPTIGIYTFMTGSMVESGVTFTGYPASISFFGGAVFWGTPGTTWTPPTFAYIQVQAELIIQSAGALMSANSMQIYQPAIIRGRATQLGEAGLVTLGSAGVIKVSVSQLNPSVLLLDKVRVMAYAGLLADSSLGNSHTIAFINGSRVNVTGLTPFGVAEPTGDVSAIYTLNVVTWDNRDERLTLPAGVGLFLPTRTRLNLSVCTYAPNTVLPGDPPLHVVVPTNCSATDIYNACVSSPCSATGTASCTSLQNGYTCNCKPGYMGMLCETDIDECASQGCQNGATCVDLVNSFNCTCTQYFAGQLCQDDVNECLTNNGGCGPSNLSTCNNTFGGWSCTPFFWPGSLTPAPGSNLLSTSPLVYASLNAGNAIDANVSFVTYQWSQLAGWIGTDARPLSFPCTLIGLNTPFDSYANWRVRCQMPSIAGTGLKLWVARASDNAVLSPGSPLSFAVPPPTITPNTLRRNDTNLLPGSIPSDHVNMDTVQAVPVQFRGTNLFWDNPTPGTFMRVHYGPVTDRLRYACAVTSPLLSGLILTSTTVTCRLTPGSQGVDNIFTVDVNAQLAFGTDSIDFPIVPSVTRVMGCPDVPLPPPPDFPCAPTPTAGCPTEGGVRITVAGTNFAQRSTSVTVAGKPCTNVTVTNAELLSCILPAAVGLHQRVQVQVSGATSIPQAFVSYHVPVVTALVSAACNAVPGRPSALLRCPRRGNPTANHGAGPGGIIITITGHDFGASGAFVMIGQRACIGPGNDNGALHDSVQPHRKLYCGLPPGTTLNRPVVVVQGGTVTSSNTSLSYRQCVPGTYARGTSCFDCALGLFSGIDEAQDCQPCVSGTVSGPAPSSNCTNCAAGSYALAGLTACSACVAGTAQPAEGQSICPQCEQGKYAGADGARGCVECEPGKYQSALGATTCVDCPVGRAVGERAQHACPLCEAGSAAPTPGMTSCPTCDAGRFAPVPESAECALCPIGKTSLGSGQATCAGCLLGQYGSFDNVTGGACHDCPGGTFQPDPAGASCQVCPGGQFSGPRSARCTECSPGRFSPPPGSNSACYPCPDDSKSNGLGTYCDCPAGEYATSDDALMRCDACPVGAVCTQSGMRVSLLISEEGYWRAEATSLNFYRCLQPGDCTGGGCADNRDGPVCAYCKEGYRSETTGSACAPCPSKSASLGGSVGFAIILLVCVLIVFYGMWHSDGHVAKARDPYHRVKAFTQEDRVAPNYMYNFKLLIGYLQVATALMDMVDIPWPSYFLTFIGYFDFVNLDFLPWGSIECVATLSFYDRLVAYAVVPPLFISLLAVVPLLMLHIADRMDHSDDIRQRLRRKLSRRKVLRLVIFALFLVYPTVSARVLSFFSCRTVNGVTYLTADFHLPCYTTRWFSYLPLAIVCVGVYPLGIPAVLLFVLWRNRNFLSTPRIKLAYGLLYDGFHRQLYWFEIADLCEKLLLTSVLQFFDARAQPAAGLVVVTLYLCVLLYFAPYIRRIDDRLSQTIQCHLYLILFTGYLLQRIGFNKGSPEDVLASIVLLAVLALLVVLLLYHGAVFLRAIVRAWQRRRAMAKSTVMMANPLSAGDGLALGLAGMSGASDDTSGARTPTSGASPDFSAVRDTPAISAVAAAVKGADAKANGGSASKSLRNGTARDRKTRAHTASTAAVIPDKKIDDLFDAMALDADDDVGDGLESDTDEDGEKFDVPDLPVRMVAPSAVGGGGSLAVAMAGGKFSSRASAVAAALVPGHRKTATMGARDSLFAHGGTGGALAYHPANSAVAAAPGHARGASAVGAALPALNEHVSRPMHPGVHARVRSTQLTRTVNGDLVMTTAYVPDDDGPGAGPPPQDAEGGFAAADVTAPVPADADDFDADNATRNAARRLSTQARALVDDDDAAAVMAPPPPPPPPARKVPPPPPARPAAPGASRVAAAAAEAAAAAAAAEAAAAEAAAAAAAEAAAAVEAEAAAAEAAAAAAASASATAAVTAAAAAAAPSAHGDDEDGPAPPPPAADDDVPVAVAPATAVAPAAARALPKLPPAPPARAGAARGGSSKPPLPPPPKLPPVPKRP